MRPGNTITAYLTPDSFDRAVAFCRSIGKEYPGPKMSSSDLLPNGQHIKKTFMIFDGVPDRVSSTRWVRIQHPFVGSLPRSGSPQPERMRGLTET